MAIVCVCVFKASLKLSAERAGYKIVTTRFLVILNLRLRPWFLGSINLVFPSESWYNYLKKCYTKINDVEVAKSVKVWRAFNMQGLIIVYSLGI